MNPFTCTTRVTAAILPVLTLLPMASSSYLFRVTKYTTPDVNWRIKILFIYYLCFTSHILIHILSKQKHTSYTCSTQALLFTQRLIHSIIHQHWLMETLCIYLYIVYRKCNSIFTLQSKKNSAFSQKRTIQFFFSILATSMLTRWCCWHYKCHALIDFKFVE